MGLFSRYINRGAKSTEKLDNRANRRQPERTDDMKRVKAQIEVNGQPVWISGNGVQELVDKALTAQRQPIAYDPKPFCEYASEFLMIYKGNGSIQKNTLIGYKGYLMNHLLPFFGEMDIKSISTNDIQAYVNLKSSAYTAKTIREHLDLMNQIFESAIEDRLIQRNPCQSKRLTIVGRKSHAVEAYEEDEYKLLESLLDYLVGSEKICLALSLYTGMRQGEMFALTWDDIDMDREEIHVRASVEWPSSNQGSIKEPKTENGYRTIPIIPQLYAILNEWWGSSGFVLTGARCSKDSPMSRQGVKRLYERINMTAKAHGIDVVFLSHRGRHSIATNLNNAGADDVTISSVMGHSDVNFTKKQYVSRQTSQTRRGMNKMSNYIASI